MSLANKVAGFPLAECDEVRRAILKRNVSMSDSKNKKSYFDFT